MLHVFFLEMKSLKKQKKNDENHSSSSVCDDGRGNVKIDRDKDGKSNHWCTYDTVERFG